MPPTFSRSDSLLFRVMMVLYQQQNLPCDELQRAINEEIGRFDLMKQSDDESLLSRRDALVMLASLPLSMLVKAPQVRVNAVFAEEFLTQCAASITACWHLMRGNQLSVVEEVLSAYLPVLTVFLENPSKYQKTVASLITQGYRINGILALHRNNLRERELCCQLAVQYSELAENPGLLVSALISLASTFYYSRNPEKAAQIYQRALTYRDEISPLLLARIYIELAVVYAQQKQEQEALRYMSLAQEIYPEYPEGDPSFLYAEFTPSSMILEEGLTHLALAQHYSDRAYPQQTWEVFSRFERLSVTVPERIRVEIINNQAKTALAMNDMDVFCNRIEQGVYGAKALGSKRRRQEALDVYKEARQLWPNELRIKELADLFL